MTVAELIVKLQKCDPALDVVIATDDDYFLIDMIERDDNYVVISSSELSEY